MEKLSKVVVVGKDSELLFGSLQKNGFEIVENNPDFIISLGGDGTILHSEQAYPEILKLSVKNSSHCHKCTSIPAVKWMHSGVLFCFKCFEKQLEAISANNYKVMEYEKLEGKALSKEREFRMLGLNEVQLHNVNPLHAVRIDSYLDGTPLYENVISDGVIVSTVFGSTGYFRSVTRKHFDNGYGIAFNNPTSSLNPIFLGKKFEFKAIIKRRQAVMLSDNSPFQAFLEEGDEMIVRPAREKARFIV